MKVFIIPIDGREFYTTSAQDVIDSLLPELHNMDSGESLEIKSVEMTKEELETLPEFDC